MKVRLVAFSALFALSAACTPEPPPRLALVPTTEESALLERVALLDAAPPGAKEIGSIEGRVCKVGLHDRSPTQAEALAQLRLRALRKGANAVVVKGCDEDGMSLVANCFETMTCSGMAVWRP
jgi:hypothetical protein